MSLNEIKTHLVNYGEIQFLFRGGTYMLSCFWVKPLFQKGRKEYWLSSSLDEKRDVQKACTLEEMLNIEIEGEKLKTVLETVEIIDIF